MSAVAGRTVQPTSGRRKGSKKLRTGCLTCRVRKVKCDEQRPFCLRCVTTGRTCDGYPVPVTASHSRQAANQSAGSGCARLSLSRSVRSSPEFESPDETRAFDFYLKRSAAALGGDMNTAFWANLVIPLCSHEPVIKHAVLAVSSFHLHHVKACSDGLHSGQRAVTYDEKLGFIEYGKAIRSLQSWRPALDEVAMSTGITPLVACVLFICIEFLRGNQAASHMHIDHGRKMLASITRDANPHVLGMLRRHVVPMYTRLSLPSFLFGSIPAPIPDFLQAQSSSTPVSPSPLLAMLGDTGPRSIEHARDQLYQLAEAAMPYLAAAQYYKALDTALAESLQSSRLELLTALEQWDVAFTALVVGLPPSAQPSMTIPLLRLYREALRLWVDLGLEPNDEVFDSRLGSFSAIVTHGSAAIDAMQRQSVGRSGASRTSAGGEFMFSFETEVIAPLYWTVIRCRHPVLRRAALGLLRKDQVKRRRENLWHAEAVAAVASRIIAMEEGEDGEDEEEDAEQKAKAGEDHAAQRHGLFPCTTANGTTPLPSGGSIALDDYLPPAFVGADGKFQIPFSEPPTLPRFLDLSDLVLLTTQMADLQIVDADSSWQDLPLNPSIPTTPPFGIPSSRRVRTALVGPRGVGGIWATLIKDPLPGEDKWVMKRLFVKY